MLQNFTLQIFALFQADAYPWIAVLLRDEDTEAEYINSKCGAVLVSKSPTITLTFLVCG